MVLNGNGNVGIGTTAPGSQLHILKTGAVANTDGLMLENTTANEKYMLMAGILGSTSGGFSIYDKTNSAVRLAIANDGDIGIGYGDPGTAKLAINGKVGIGTTAPAEKLEVAGNIAADTTKTLSLNIGNFKIISVLDTLCAVNAADTLRIFPPR
jgi:hypothetical protein